MRDRKTFHLHANAPHSIFYPPACIQQEEEQGGGAIKPGLMNSDSRFCDTEIHLPIRPGEVSTPKYKNGQKSEYFEQFMDSDRGLHGDRTQISDAVITGQNHFLLS